jgi:hypothetical protein
MAKKKIRRNIKMAIMNLNKDNKLVQLGNRNDFCYLCAKEIAAKNERDYADQMAKLKGKEEGKPCVKFVRAGTETMICLAHIHQIAKENPLPEASDAK